MPQTRQTIANSKDGPIYVSVEPWPECFELEPGDKLTLIWNAAENDETVQINFLNERELVVWPNGEIDQMQFLINGAEAEGRSWAFKYR